MSRVFVLNEPRSPRLSPTLAVEIGLNESILLLQLEYWIDVSGHERQGQMWTYQSLSDLKREFPFWGKETINRAIKSLQEQRLIHVTRKHNRRAADNTRWFSIDTTGCNTLTSIRMLRVKTLTQNESALSQIETTLTQNETALPQTSLILPSINGQSHTQGEDDPDLDEAFDNWAFGLEELLPAQPVLLPSFLPRVKKPHTTTLEPVSKAYHYALYRLCYRAEDEKEVLLLNSSQRGRVAGILGELRDAGADLNKIHVFEAWWSQNWRSRDKASKQYQSPRPEQVHEHWLEAMKANIVPKTHNHVPEKAKEYVSNLQQAMEMRAKQRNNK